MLRRLNLLQPVPGRYDFGVATAGAPSADWVLCWAHDGSSAWVAVGQFTMGGAAADPPAPAAGVPFDLEVAESACAHSRYQ